MEESEKARIARVKDFLCSYQLCIDMLNLRRYERKRAERFAEIFDGEDILTGNEALWRARMHEIGALIDSMRNCREKVILYSHYIRGESIEHAANLVGVSRRTGYRLHDKGLFMASFLYERMKKTESALWE